ncbi:MAG TPA: S16 family serine protease [Nitrospira sp.]|nr:S16 family serine protease [Nitrospira sp.]
MTIERTTWKRDLRFTHRNICSLLMKGCAVVLLAVVCLAAFVDAAGAQDNPREQYIPVLCVTPGEKPTGTITYIMVLFTKRGDAGGLDVHFINGPGRFSQSTQVATMQAIARTARALGLSTDSWSVGLSVHDPGVIIEGDSLSAMVGLTVVAMAKGESIPRNRVITGTVTSDGRIGPVGGVALKVLAARQAGLQMVLVPSTTDGKGRTPAFTQVFKVGSVSQAYEALTAPQSSNFRSS